MTLCTGSPAERSLERYIQGTLPELEARSFEEHYFDCPVCLAQVEALQAVTMQFVRHPVAPPVAAKTRRFAWPLRATASLGAIAAALILGYIGVRAMHRSAPPNTAHTPPTMVQQPPPPAPSPTMASLADLSLPAFQSSALRGANSDTSFTAGMKAFSAQDCPSAIRSLSHVNPQDDDALAAQLYLGVCQLSERQFDPALATLRKVVAAGDSPQQEAALYALAQLSLLRHDASAARHNLARAIALHGDFETRARTQLEKLR